MLETESSEQNRSYMAQQERFKKFYKRSILDRLNILGQENPHLGTIGSLPESIADQMIENYIYSYQLPLGVAVNFTINQIDYQIPMAVEEPSVIAAASNAAKQFDNIETTYTNRIITGQVVLYELTHLATAKRVILEEKESLLEIARKASVSMVRRGGGPLDIRFETFSSSNEAYLTVYLDFNPCEAMGANAINTCLEALAPELEYLTGGRALMSILSNYSDQSIATARVEQSIDGLADNPTEAEDLAYRLMLASDYAHIDSYRATTHNKGIMNGIDAVAIATGNDWRAIEASVHAYATKEGRYQSMSTWTYDKEQRILIGELSLPIPVGTVGGTLAIHPGAQWSHRLLKEPTASQLAQIIVAVGLMQNFAAIKALVTSGIQAGHMKMQARSLALQAGASLGEVDALVELLKKAPSINSQIARDLLNQLRKNG